MTKLVKMIKAGDLQSNNRFVKDLLNIKFKEFKLI